MYVAGLNRHTLCRKQFPFFGAFTGAPYTYSGLNCSGSDCRSNREQSSPSIRSTISGSPIHLADFHTVPLGYLICHSQALKNVSMFLKSNDFAKKSLSPLPEKSNRDLLCAKHLELHSPASVQRYLRGGIMRSSGQWGCPRHLVSELTRYKPAAWGGFPPMPPAYTIPEQSSGEPKTKNTHADEHGYFTVKAGESKTGQPNRKRKPPPLRPRRRAGRRALGP